MFVLPSLCPCGRQCLPGGRIEVCHAGRKLCIPVTTGPGVCNTRVSRNQEWASISTVICGGAFPCIRGGIVVSFHNAIHLITTVAFDETFIFIGVTGEFSADER